MAIIQETNVNLATHVRDVLNAAGGSVSNDLTSFFKSAAKLNMWSRYKPVISKTLFFTLSEWKGTGYRGDNDDCGITIPYYTSPSAIRTALADGKAMWSYNIPAGGENAPFRLGDFRGYNTDAVNPIGELADKYYLRSTNTGYEFDIQVEVVAGTQEKDHNLILSDFKANKISLTDMYLGVYMVPKSGSGYFFGTSSTKLGSADSITMTLKGSSGTTGAYTAYPFLASTSQADSENDGTFVSINKLGQIINIISSASIYTFDVYSTWNSANTSFAYEVTANNNNSTAVTFQNLTLHLVWATSEANLYGGNYTGTTSRLLASSVSVPANSFERYESSWNYTRNDSYFYGVYVSSTSPQVTGDLMPVEDDPNIEYTI